MIKVELLWEQEIFLLLKGFREKKTKEIYFEIWGYSVENSCTKVNFEFYSVGR